MAISISEYCARVRRLRLAVPDLEVGFHVDEGLSLIFRKGRDKQRVVYTGETDIVVAVEEDIKKMLEKAAAEMSDPVTYTPFKKAGP